MPAAVHDAPLHALVVTRLAVGQNMLCHAAQLWVSCWFGVMFCFAASQVHLKATVVNTANVRLRKLTLTPGQHIPADQSFTCTIKDTSSSEPGTEAWLLAGDVAPSKTVVCLGSYEIGQDLLEAAAPIDGNVPQLSVKLEVDAEVTDAAQKLHREASVQVTVLHSPGVQAEIVQGSCEVPDGPGTDRRLE